VTQVERRRFPLRGILDAVENAPPVEAVQAVTRELGDALGATDVSLLIADLSGRALVRLAQHWTAGDETGPTAGGGEPHRRNDSESATVIPFDGGPEEQALRDQVLQVLPPGGRGGPDSWRVLAPVTERGEVLGLLDLELPAEPDRDVLGEIKRTAHMLGFVLIATRRHTDLFEWGQRSTQYSLSAEIQRRLLPAAYTCEAGAFTLSAWLEPAATVGGDTFDYSVARDHLHLSITDAMGHGVASALTSTLCVGSLRNTRRSGGSLLRAGRCGQRGAGRARREHARRGLRDGILGRLDLNTAVLSLVNAGHVAAFPLPGRGGAAGGLGGRPPAGHVRRRHLPLVRAGAGAGRPARPRDRRMLERNAANFDIAGVIVETSALHPRETTRWLADRVLEATGHALADDATLFVLDWHGGHGADRNSVAGADLPRT
jgi:hypothetical protein